MIKHIKCDIFESGADLILHQVNCQGAMNSGVAKQVREKYPNVYVQYKNLCDMHNENKSGLLGKTLVVDTGDNFIANLFAQEFYGYDGKCYTDYNALKKCLQTANNYLDWDDVVAIPYLMGCYRGGGDWNVVHRMIEEIFVDNDVLICEYNGG